VSGRILVATDGSEAARGAIAVASALAASGAGPVEVVTVIEPLPVYGASMVDMIAYTWRQIDRVGENPARDRVAAQLAAAGPDAASWPITLEVGPVAYSILKVAREKAATLLVLGLGRHTLSDRWLGSETALRVMRVSPIPVLAVPADARELPRVAVLAVDLSDQSRAAARASVDLLPEGAAVHLAHVLPELPLEFVWLGPEDWQQAQRRGAAERLGELGKELEEAAACETEVHLLDGDPGREILRLAERVSAGLIAAGTHGAGVFGRVLVGSVSTRLVRGATCPVLVVPPGRPPADAPPGPAG
jgi:nucleotide-binding universal stress UspA family protein